MPASALRHKAFGWAGPQPARYSATVSGTSFVIPITGGVPVAGAVTPTQFTCTVAGVARGVTGATVAGQNCTLTLASAATAGQLVVVTYAGGGAAPLKNAAGDLTPPFTVSATHA